MTGKVLSAKRNVKGVDRQVFNKLKKLYEAGDFESVLKAEELHTVTPVMLGTEGIEILLKSLAGYLGESQEKGVLNDFHKVLINTEKVPDLKQYKDNEELLKQGMESAFVAVELDEFRKIFANVHNGKKNLNHNWNGIVERFWGVKSELAVYFTCLWIIIRKKESGIDLYIDEAGKENRIERLPVILKIYMDFVMDGKNFVSVRLKKKILGHCFDCNDTEALIHSAAYFDEDSIPEVREVVAFLEEKRLISSEDLIRWFHSGMKELVAEKIVNYFWWRTASQGLHRELFKVLASVFQEYPESYFTEILYNTACPMFGKKVKEQILCENFELLCQNTRTYKKAYILVNYLYNNLIEVLNDETLDTAWNELKVWMKNQVMQQLSPDIRTAGIIEVFRYDDLLRQELENYYCDTFIAEKMAHILSEEELGEFVNECEKKGLQFIIQWIVDHGGTSVTQDEERYIRSLISTKQFEEAIRFIRTEATFGNARKIEMLREVLCENFKIYHISENAYKIFQHSIPVEAAESIFLKDLAFSESSVLVALIAIYIYKKDWLKVVFLYAPFKVMHIDAHRKFIDDVRLVMKENHIDSKNLTDSHYDVMKVALKLCKKEEFDAFVHWAKQIPVPNTSKTYKPKPKTFDSALKSMLSDADYDSCWKQLVITALRTDNKDKQDTLRYCIIAGFIGRYGIDEFDQVVLGLAKNKYSVKSYTDYYISLWKGLFNGKYSLNFLPLSCDLIREAPTTFWNLFYDIAICKNHVFSTDDFEMKVWKEAVREDQKFYDGVLSRYNDTRETVFLKIAVQILLESSKNLVPSFEKYLSYCSSGRNKDFLFSALIQLVYKGSYLQEISELLDYSYWHCTEIEQKVLRMLAAFCRNDYSYIFDEEGQVFSEAEMKSFRQDYLKSALKYPEINIIQTVQDSIYGNAYRYKLLQFLLQLKNYKQQYYDPNYTVLKREIDEAPEITDDWKDNLEIRSYLKFLIVFYKKQVCQGSDDAMYIRNRYCRILVANMLLDVEFNQYSDDEIIAFMKSNKHFTGVYSIYDVIKKGLYEFVSLDSISSKLKAIFLMGLISNKWGSFIEHGPLYSKEALQIIRKIETYTNYRDLNIQIIKDFLVDRQEELETADLKFVEICSPGTALVIKRMREIKAADEMYFEQCQKRVSGIGRFSDPDSAKRSYTNLRYFLNAYADELKQEWNLYMQVLLATSYTKTIVINLADDIVHKRIDAEETKLWKPVFEAMNELQTYYYLLAVCYAIRQNLEESKKAYSQITVFEALPGEWSLDRNNLESYLAGKNKAFKLSSSNSIATLAAEKEAMDISFLDIVASGETSNTDTGIYEAVGAYRTIFRGESEDLTRFNAYKQLFAFIKKPDDLYEIYRQTEGRGAEERGKRHTYNELIIEYGSLLIVYDENISANDKFEILSQIFAVYELLNDANKGKSSIVSSLKNAEQMVLETPGVDFEIWMSRQERMKEIMQHPIVDCQEAVLEEWLVPVDACTKLLAHCTTQMQRLEDLGKWRENWNLSVGCSDYENAFIHAVDEEIKRLKNGVNLSITVINDVIEDQSIFYQIENHGAARDLSVLLNNMDGENQAKLMVHIGVQGETPENYEGAVFSNVLELRPGDLCGQVYRLHNHVLSKLRDGDKVEVILNVVVGDKVICNNSRQKVVFDYVKRSGALQPGIIPDTKVYEIAVPAFSKTITGFGRNLEKQRIREYLEQQLVIIYGPSRAGKSSLLNYISNQYVQEYALLHPETAIMSTMIADEQYSKNDYKFHMLNGEPLSFENAGQIMEYLFLAPMAMAFSSEANIKQRRRCKYIGTKFPESVKEEIREILNEEGSVRDKYAVISQVLEENNCQIWLLYDEFQQIIERWKGNANELAELCSDIKYNQGGIRLVLCGSDDLVRLFECENDLNWNEFKIKTSSNCVFVGQLNDEDFYAVMNDRDIWKGLPENIPWSRPALELLYKYTGGNAICGKLFGNELLEKQKAGDFKYRDYIYPSDITQTAYKLLNSEVGRVKNLLVVHTTKNLDHEIPYLIFIANELVQDRNKSDVSLRKIREFFTSKSYSDVDMALKILIARGILKVDSEKQRYGFTTMFYYDFFRNQATDTKMQEIRAGAQSKPVEHRTWLGFVKDSIKENAGEITTGNAIDIIDVMPPSVKDGVREHYEKGSTVIHTDTYVEENSGEINKIQVNVQSITNTLNGILAAGDNTKELLLGIQALPRLSAYLPPALENGEIQELSEEKLSRSIDNYCADMEEGISSSNVIRETEIPYWEILQITQEEFDEFMEQYDLPEFFLNSLKFAYQLEQLFNKGAVGSDSANIDYSPVTIMYCKLIESLLKEYHIDIYSKCLTNLATDMSKPKDKKEKYKWGEIAGLPQQQKQKLTIGSFVFPLSRSWTIDKLAQVTHQSCEEWNTHKDMITAVKEIRNPSAHGNKDHRIRMEQKDALTKQLFTDGGFLRLIEIAAG